MSGRTRPQEEEGAQTIGFPAAPDMVFPEVAQTWAEAVILLLRRASHEESAAPARDQAETDSARAEPAHA